MKNKSNVKNGIKYILLFVLFLLTLLFFYIPFRMDTYANYGFSYGIANLQIPYKEFNLIIPLFGPFLYSILLFINKSILCYYIEQSFFLVLFCYYLFKLLKEKAWLIIVSMFCPFIFCFAYCLFPGYNFLILFEFVLLLYLEKNNKDDKWIGIIAGLTILTKQNIGFFVFLVSIIYPFFHNKKKSLTRFLFGMIPILIFLLYLIFTKSLYSFINLCFLNMKEFSGNFQVTNLYLFLAIFSILILFLQFIKNPSKNISYFYLLAYLPVIYPLMEEYHVSLFLFLGLIVYIYNKEFTLPKKTPIYSFIIILSMISIYDILGIKHYSKLNIYHYHNFPFEFASPSLKKDYDKIIEFVQDKRVVYVGDPAKTIFFSSTTNSKLDHYYILFKGNQGYQGNQKLKARIQKEKDTYFIVSDYIECYDKACQFDMTIPEMIKENYQLVEQLNYFSIYYKEK